MLLHTYEGLDIITVRLLPSSNPTLPYPAFSHSSLLQTIKAPILLIHAHNDWDIPSTHSSALFSSALEPHLPAIPTAPLAASSSWTQEQWETFYKAQEERKAVYEKIVTSREIRNFGSLESFERGVEEGGGGKVVLLKTIEGGHNKVGAHEGVHEVIRSTFGFN